MMYDRYFRWILWNNTTTSYLNLQGYLKVRVWHIPPHSPSQLVRNILAPVSELPASVWREQVANIHSSLRGYVATILHGSGPQFHAIAFISRLLSLMRSMIYYWGLDADADHIKYFFPYNRPHSLCKRRPSVCSPRCGVGGGAYSLVLYHITCTSE